MSFVNNAVSVQVITRNGAPVLVAKDNTLNIEYHALLPAKLLEMPLYKQGYWIDKEMKVLAKKMLRKIGGIKIVEDPPEGIPVDNLLIT